MQSDELEDIPEEDDDDESPRALRKLAKLEKELEKDEDEYL